MRSKNFNTIDNFILFENVDEMGTFLGKKKYPLKSHHILMTLNISSSKPKTNRLRLTRITREALNSRRNNPTFLNGTSPC